MQTRDPNAPHPRDALREIRQILFVDTERRRTIAAQDPRALGDRGQWMHAQVHRDPRRRESFDAFEIFEALGLDARAQVERVLQLRRPLARTCEEQAPGRERLDPPQLTRRRAIE
jgi:hypothetical protein